MSAIYDHDVQLATDSVEAMALDSGEEGEAVKEANATRNVLLAKLQTRLDAFENHHKASSGNGRSDFDESIAPRPKPAEPRRPETFSGEGSQDQAGEVRRFANQMSLYFDLADIPAQDHVAHARLYLKGAAADYVHTAMQTMSASDRTDWSAFCELLGTRFGCIDPDSEFWDQLRDLK